MRYFEIIDYAALKKQEVESYKKLAKPIDKPCEDLTKMAISDGLHLTDNRKKLIEID